MFEIVHKQILADDIKRIDIMAPEIAAKAKPGQFVGISPEEGDERIPLTVVDTDANRGTITLIVREVGATTGKLGSLPINESVFSLIGPLGIEAKIEKVGTVVCIAAGIGVAQILPISKSLRDKGNKVIGIIGAKTKKKIVLEPQMRKCCSKIFVTTEDGSFERRGKVTDVFQRVLIDNQVDLVYAIGRPEMMKAVCDITRVRKIPTRVQLSPFMVDCLGMCGACRVRIGDKMMRACVDGPEFDGHLVDFDDYKKRQQFFEENGGCHSHKSQSSRKQSGSGILTKFLSDILGK
jgi:ferredoxin--NADP+ reductase